MEYNVTENSTSIFINDEEALKITPDKLYVADKEVSLVGHTHEGQGGNVDVDLSGVEAEIADLDDKCNAIISSIGPITDELMGNDERSMIYINISKLNSDVKSFVDLNKEYTKDMFLDDTEKAKLNESLEAIELSKSRLDKSFAGLVTLCEMNEANAEDENKLKFQYAKEKILKLKDELTDKFGQLTTAIEAILIGNGFITEADLSVLLRGLSSYNTAIKRVKKGVDDVTVVNIGGSLSDRLIDLKVEQYILSLAQSEMKLEQDYMQSEINKRLSADDLANYYNTIHPDSVRVAFNNLSSDVTISGDGLTVRRGYISSDSICSTNSVSPALSLARYGFDRNSLSLDATNYDAIRLKYNSGNYVYVGDGKIDFYVGGSYVGGVNSGGVRGVSWSNITGKPYSFTPSSHNHSGENLNPYSLGASSGTILMQSSLDGNRKNLGWSQSKFNQVSAVAVYGDSGSVSDIKFKENIRYIGEQSDKLRVGSVSPLIKPNLRSNINLDINSDDLHKFIMDDLKLCEYNYTKEYLGEEDNTVENKIGFVAQDLVGTKVGQLMVKEHEGNLVYNLNNFVSVIAGALQVEMKKRTELEKELAEIKEEIKSIKNK